MKIFISWSGEESQQVARALKAFLKKLLQATEPWMSEVDIQPGTRWSERIASELQLSQFGIICVTPENRSSEWINFEAGALSIAMGDLDRKVVPLLIGFEERGDLHRGPLGLFNAVRFMEDDVWKLVLTLNGELEVGLDGNDLRELFDVFWPKLEVEVAKLQELAGTPKLPKKSQSELTQEILDTVLEIQRQLQLQSKGDESIPLAALLAAAGPTWPTASPTQRVSDRYVVSERRPDKALTTREREIARLAQSGMSIREIAQLLTLSSRTVEGHLYQIFAKLGITSFSDLPTDRESGSDKDA
ncbi:DNA-binding CsgD family transcriptional regulator [Arthrobacter pascens]|uniref:LuxR C-terminal-related transcriptional regulator n=1 Tax=Arthrobacter pascens TaxID=1677 RepID=UPI002781C583|nr:DNA-binding CsgD family transcriptional regulator [Arthrobacter pascens]